MAGSENGAGVSLQGEQQSLVGSVSTAACYGLGQRLRDGQSGQRRVGGSTENGSWQREGQPGSVKRPR